MRVLIDTNILTRSSQPHVLPASTQAVDALAKLRSQGNRLCLVPQVLYEFWVVATRSIAQNGLELVTADVAREVERLTKHFEIYHDTPAVFDHWMTVVAQHDIKGKRAHDVRLVAAAMAHGLDGILTFNDTDFSRFSQIKLLTPQGVMTS
jgi:predicted nucleic acid-binding protein